jgi:hypothetical protein
MGLSNRDGLIVIAVLAALIAVAYLAIPGQIGALIVIGVVGGLAAATFAILPRNGGAGAAKHLFGMAIFALLFGLVLRFVFTSEMAHSDLGAVALGTVSAANAVFGFFVGVALRAAWLALRTLR